MAVNWANENIYEVDDPYNLRLGTDDRRRNDRGARIPSDLNDVYPGEKVQSLSGTMGPNAPGPGSPGHGGCGIPQPDGYGGEKTMPDAPPPGPDSDAYDPDEGSGSTQQDALNELPDADESRFNNCPYVTNTWVLVDLVAQPDGGGPCKNTREAPDRFICTNDGWYIEKIVFNCQADALAYRNELDATITKKGLTGDTVLFFSTYTASTDDCMNTGDCDGPIAYHNENPNGYGAGALRDDIDSYGY